MLPMNSRSSVSRPLAAATLLICVFAAPALGHLPLPPKKGEIGRIANRSTVPEFILLDQDGKPFRITSARGKIILVTFVFTTCPDVCPLLTAKFASIQRGLEQRKMKDYLLLSITTDPERDTPSALKSYAQGFKADFGHWRFLTGSEQDLAKVWQAFGVTVRKSGEQVQHTTLTTLIDRHGIRRVDYYTDKWQEKEILRDIASLDAPSHR